MSIRSGDLIEYHYVIDDLLDVIKSWCCNIDNDVPDIKDFKEGKIQLASKTNPKSSHAQTNCIFVTGTGVHLGPFIYLCWNNYYTMTSSETYTSSGNNSVKLNLQFQKNNCCKRVSSETVRSQLNSFLSSRGMSNKENTIITFRGIINIYNNIVCFLASRLKHLTTFESDQSYVFYDDGSDITYIQPGIYDVYSEYEKIYKSTVIPAYDSILNSLLDQNTIRQNILATLSMSSSSSSSSSSCSSCSCSSSCSSSSCSHIVYMLI